MTFGKYSNHTVHDILYVFEKPDYLRWVYYNSSNISFMDEILELIGVTQKIIKPGKEPDLFEKNEKQVYERRELTVAEASILKNIKQAKIKRRAKAQKVKEWKDSNFTKSESLSINRTYRNPFL